MKWNEIVGLEDIRGLSSFLLFVLCFDVWEDGGRKMVDVKTHGRRKGRWCKAVYNSYVAFRYGEPKNAQRLRPPLPVQIG
jgi:hypothetical protein